jgi:hypothetical protein
LVSGPRSNKHIYKAPQTGMEQDIQQENHGMTPFSPRKEGNLKASIFKVCNAA